MRTGITIDGGGILGIGSVRFLKELNYNNEDFVAGTSVGAIIAALRGMGKSWDQVYNIFKTEGAGIFKKPSFMWRVNPLKPKYDNENLKAILKKYLGDTKMSQLIIPTFITTSDFKIGKPKVYDRSDDILVRDAVLQSTAAPTYFPPVANRFADGGLWGNNPALVGVAGYADKNKVDPAQIRVLSIGTNGDFYHGSEISENLNALQWANRIIQFELQCTEDVTGFYASRLMGNRYFRVEPYLTTGYALDSISSMDAYEMIWYKHWLANKTEILDWINK
jgi:hypothetical protein